MKIYAGLAISLLLLTVSARAQHVNLGVKGGLNLYNIKNENGAKYDTRAGFHLGLLGHIHLDKQLALQPELLYSAQGAKFTSNGTETELKIGYINVPVLIQYMFDNGFRFEAGPQVGFLVNAKSETNNNSVDFKDDLNAIDFALAFGLGYIHVPSGFGVDARYNLGLTDINDNSPVKSTNRGFQLGVFYQFKHH